MMFSSNLLSIFRIFSDSSFFSISFSFNIDKSFIISSIFNSKYSLLISKSLVYSSILNSKSLLSSHKIFSNSSKFLIFQSISAWNLDFS
ncbi:MAG: hypothetical protein LBC61_05900 [Candidatus Peribacteria bacterium]|nr:hypothetical protein [Candidatus Peribacteria bacterium]